MLRNLLFMLYVGSSCELDFPQVRFCFTLAPKGSAVRVCGHRRTSRRPGLLINGSIMPVVTCLCCISMTFFVCLLGVLGTDPTARSQTVTAH